MHAYQIRVTTINIINDNQKYLYKGRAIEAEE